MNEGTHRNDGIPWKERRFIGDSTKRDRDL